MNIYLVAQQMLILFALMAAGYILWRIGWIDATASSRISRLVVNVFNPFLTISSVFGKSLASTGSVFWQNLALVVGFYTILLLAGLLVVFIIRPDSTESPVYRMLTLLPNCGFMGIPVVASLLGTEYIIYVSVYMLAYNIILYTYGIHLVKKARPNPYDSDGASGESEKFSFAAQVKSIFGNFGVVSSLVALFFFFLGIPVPESVQTFCTYMGNPCIPLSMILIGCSVASVSLPSLLRNVRVYGFILIKLLVIPIACTFLIRLLPFDETILKLFIIMLSMPAGSMVVLVTEQYDGNIRCATGGVILSTLASIVTIPLVSLFL